MADIWRVFDGQVRREDIERETTAYIVVPDGNVSKRTMTLNGNVRYFLNRKEAIEYAISQNKAAIPKLERELADRNVQLGHLKSLLNAE